VVIDFPAYIPAASIVSTLKDVPFMLEKRELPLPKYFIVFNMKCNWSSEKASIRKPLVELLR
jgi:hypothetical protein